MRKKHARRNYNKKNTQIQDWNNSSSYNIEQCCKLYTVKLLLYGAFNHPVIKVWQ